MPVVLLLAALLAGCGEGSHAASSPIARASNAEGSRVFATSCSGCHSLAEHPRPIPVGGSLRGYRLTEAEVTSFTRVMPVKLSEREIRAVSTYVARVERAAGPPRAR